MQAQPDPRLEQARRLIKEKRQNEARAILVEILKANPNDVTSLYLYAHVARNPQEAEKVLKRVLELDPLNYQARAALNKLQNRSVEQQPVDAPPPPIEVSAPPPALGGNVPLPVFDAPSLEKRAGSPRPQAASGGNGLLYVLAGAAILLLVVAGVAFVLMSDEEETPADNNNVVGDNTVIQSTAIRATQNAVDTQIAELPPTWTPSNTPTQRPSRTPAPTLTPFPTRTLFPTTAPTEPTVEALDIDLRTISRLYTDYTELTAQAGWAEDTDALDRIEASYQAIIASLELSEYDQNEDLDTEWVDFLDEFVVLIQQQLEIVSSRRASLGSNPEVSPDDVATQVLESLGQQEAVEEQFYALIAGASATANFENQLNALKTPSVTPIVLPTLATGN